MHEEQHIVFPNRTNGTDLPSSFNSRLSLCWTSIVIDVLLEVNLNNNKFG